MTLKRRALALLSVSAFFIVLYDFTATRAFSYDGISYALAIERNAIAFLFCAYHLLHTVIGWLVFKVFIALGHPVRAVPLLQQINAVVGGCTVGFFFWLLSLKFSPWRALLGAAALGLGSAFWMEAVDPGCYAWASLASCVLLAVIIEGKDLSSFRVGLIHGATILFHQMLVLAIPALLVQRWKRRPGEYLAGVLISAGSVYAVVAAVFYGHSWHEAWMWLFGPAGWPANRPMEMMHWWNFRLLDNLAASWRGLIDSLFVPVPGTPLGFSILKQGLLISFLVWLVIASRNYFKGKKWIGDPLATLWIWVLVMNFVFVFYVPGTVRFRLLFLPALIYGGLMLESQEKHRWMPWGLGAVVACMALVNYHWGIAPQAQPENNTSLMRTLWVNHLLRPDDVFLFAGGSKDSIINIYVPYFAPEIKGRSLRGYFFANPHGDLMELRQLVHEARNNHRRVFVEAQLFNPETQKTLDAEQGLAPGSIQKWLESLGLRREWAGPPNGSYGVYRIN